MSAALKTDVLSWATKTRDAPVQGPAGGARRLLALPHDARVQRRADTQGATRPDCQVSTYPFPSTSSSSLTTDLGTWMGHNCLHDISFLQVPEFHGETGKKTMCAR